MIDWEGNTHPRHLPLHTSIPPPSPTGILSPGGYTESQPEDQPSWLSIYTPSVNSLSTTSAQGGLCILLSHCQGRSLSCTLIGYGVTFPRLGSKPNHSHNYTWLYLQVVCSKFHNTGQTSLVRHNGHNCVYPAVPATPSGSCSPSGDPRW